MLGTTQFTAMNLGFPDVCNTVVGPAVVPIPYPNIAQSVTHVPNNLKQYYCAGSVHNTLTQGTISNGDEAGAATGVASGTIIGPDRYLVGSVKTFNGVGLASRLTNVNIQNNTNAPGVTLVPSINRVFLIG